MVRITLQNRIDSYHYGKELFLGNISRKEAAKALVNSGMSECSASVYLQCVTAMLRGERYTLTVNEMTTSLFLTNIFCEFGREGLKKALHSVREHLDYQKGKNELPSIEKLYKEFYDVL